MVSWRKLKRSYNMRSVIKPAGVSGTKALFLIQIFATLGYSVLYSTTFLYLKSLDVSVIEATGITASFIAFNFTLHLLGGYVGGRFLSYRALFVVCGVLQIVGSIIIADVNLQTFYWGIAVFLAGSGFNSICINCMVTQLFSPEDKRRQTAFLWNYSGMNLGFFIGFSIAGYFQHLQNYYWLFVITAVGNAIALLLTFCNWRVLRDVETPLTRDNVSKGMRAVGALIGIVVLVFALRFLLKHSTLSNEVIIACGIGMFFMLIYFARIQKTVLERNRLWAFLVLMLAAVIFWTLYQLMPMGLTAFINNNVDRVVMGIKIAPQWFNNVNSLVIIIGGPLVAITANRLRAKGRELNIPFLFAMGLLLIGVAFSLLPLGIYFANPEGYVNLWWIVLVYFLLAVGELCLSPIAFSAVGLLAPTNLRGVLMGVTLLTTGLAAVFSRYFSDMALGVNQVSGNFNPLLTNQTFSTTFLLLGCASILASFILMALVPSIMRLIRR